MAWVTEMESHLSSDSWKAAGFGVRPYDEVLLISGSTLLTTYQSTANGLRLVTCGTAESQFLSPPLPNLVHGQRICG